VDGVPDDELWARGAAGQVECFGALFERHEHAVRSYCHRRTGSADAAEDLASIVFLEAWRRRSQVDLSGESLLPWFLAVAARVMKQRRRTALRHRAALARLPDRPSSPDHADDVAARLDDRARLARVRAELARLSPADREVVQACIEQGLSYADAATLLGVPVGTVRSRLSRARRRLARSLDDDHDDTTRNRIATTWHDVPRPTGLLSEELS